jgi:L-cystine uptake protein TcyP (sodium:dicarboxylate symporter family)
VKQFYTVLKYLKLLKMNDIIHVMSILKSLNFKKETKALLFIVYYLILIFIWVHFFACLLWYFLRQSSYLNQVQPIWSFAFNFGSYKGDEVFDYRRAFTKYDQHYDPAEA